MKDQIGPDVVKRMKGVIAFNVTKGKGGATGTWVVDLKSGNGSITFLEKGQKSPKRADMTLTIADKDLVDMANGDLNGQSAFMSGKLKLKGNIGLAMSWDTCFVPLQVVILCLLLIREDKVIEKVQILKTTTTSPNIFLFSLSLSLSHHE